MLGLALPSPAYGGPAHNGMACVRRGRIAMNERLFASLAALLKTGPVVLASVIETRGATPRKGGSRMLVHDEGCEASVGGGLLEARVIDAARALLRSNRARQELQIDLTGRPAAVGICGGTMRIVLRRWAGGTDQARAAAIADALRAGQTFELDGHDLGADGAHEILRPDVRLLIVGGGHCALALHDLARHLDFDLWVFDERAECVALPHFAGAHTLSGDFERLVEALATPREVHVVCLNRDYASDVAALRVVCRFAPAYLGMMGSRKRIEEVLAALPEHARALQSIKAPVGIDIDAQTPHEIAVSILAQLVQARRAMASS